MQPNELRALLAKTNEVAIMPVNVEVPVKIRGEDLSGVSSAL